MAAPVRRHFLGLVSEQSLYNLTARTIELEVLPACRAHGVGVIPWSPLAGGLLGGVLGEADKGRRSSERIRKRVEERRAQLEAWEGFCRELGEKPADVALAGLLDSPAGTRPIIRPPTIARAEGSPPPLPARL